jgi:hypothetical protein
MPRRVAVAFTFFAPLLAGAQAPTHSASPAGSPGVCFQNLFGVGVCGASELCETLQECDAAHPCPDGRICTPNTCCETSLAGVCSLPVSDDPGCGNPGTCGTLAACEPILAHEDFSGVSVDESVVCGSGAQMFVEDSCPASPFTTSPLDHGRWGTAPGSCAAYAGASSRVRTGPGGALDISSCAGGATLEFDYLLDLQELGEFDRVFVTVQIDSGQELVVASNQPPGFQAFTSQSLSCAGGIVPMGRLVEDGTWRHFRHPLGPGGAATVWFYGEVYDSLFNDGQGWLFEDVRFECTDLVFENDFESGNLLPWSDTTAALPLVVVSPAGSCPGDVPNFKPCDGPEGNCLNFKTAEGPTLCLNVGFCFDTCTSSSDCATGEVCIVDTCCGEPVCAPARCDPKSGLIFGPDTPSASPTSLATTASPRRRP